MLKLTEEQDLSDLQPVMQEIHSANKEVLKKYFQQYLELWNEHEFKSSKIDESKKAQGVLHLKFLYSEIEQVYKQYTDDDLLTKSWSREISHWFNIVAYKMPIDLDVVNA